jgi:hypothetical protein
MRVKNPLKILLNNFEEVGTSKLVQNTSVGSGAYLASAF